MIGYVTLGTNDLARAAKFYDALLARDRRQTNAWNRTASSRGRPAQLALGSVSSSRSTAKPATPGNGAMVALAVDSQAKVQSGLRQSHEARREGRRPSRVCAGGTLLRRLLPRSRRQQAQRIPLSRLNRSRGGGGHCAAAY